MADTIGSFIGNTVGEAAAFAAGIAVGPLLAPLLRALENETWSQYPDMPLNAQTVAQGVAEGKVDPTAGPKEAALTGFGTAAFQTLVNIMETAPSVAEALTLIRRGQMDPTNFPLVLKRAGLEANWVPFYEGLSGTGLEPWEQPLSPADLSLGLIRGNLQNFQAPDGPAFPAGGDTSGGLVPHDPVSTIDVIKEAAASGIDAERMAVLARNVGLPPGVIEGLRMLNRGIIDVPDFYLLIAQSDARLSWGPFLLQLRYEVLTAHEGAELFLRGWLDQQSMYDIGAKNGYSPAQMDQLYQNIGRPLAIHQVWTGITRGGTYADPNKPDTPGTIRADLVAQLVATGIGIGEAHALVDAVEESNIRPEYYSLAIANRYTYPGYFVLKPLVASGAITVSQATTYLLYEGWEPTLAALTAESFAAAATTASPHVKSSATSLVTATRKAYIGGSITPAQATTALNAAGEPATAQTQLFALWDAQKVIEGTALGPVVAPPTGG